MFYTLFVSNKYQLLGNISAAFFRNLQHFLQQMGLLREQNAAERISWSMEGGFGGGGRVGSIDSLISQNM